MSQRFADAVAAALWRAVADARRIEQVAALLEAAGQKRADLSVAERCALLRVAETLRQATRPSAGCDDA